MTCQKCRGTGWYIYDHNHGTACEACCTHPGGWWPLTEYHRYGLGYEACRTPGCGAIRKIGSEELVDTGALPVWRPDPEDDWEEAEWAEATGSTDPQGPTEEALFAFRTNRRRRHEDA